MQPLRVWCPLYSSSNGHSWLYIMCLMCSHMLWAHGLDPNNPQSAKHLVALLWTHWEVRQPEEREPWRKVGCEGHAPEGIGILTSSSHLSTARDLFNHMLLLYALCMDHRPQSSGAKQPWSQTPETETKPPFAVLAVRCVQLLCHHEGKTIQNTLIHIRKSCQREFLFHFVFAVLWIQSRALCMIGWARTELYSQTTSNTQIDVYMLYILGMGCWKPWASHTH